VETVHLFKKKKSWGHFSVPIQLLKNILILQFLSHAIVGRFTQPTDGNILLTCDRIEWDDGFRFLGGAMGPRKCFVDLQICHFP